MIPTFFKNEILTIREQIVPLGSNGLIDSRPFYFMFPITLIFNLMHYIYIYRMRNGISFVNKQRFC